MELFKTCVQRKQRLIFSFFHHQSIFFKASDRLLFRLFIINQYCTPNVILPKSVFKAIGKLLFSLLSYFFNTRNVCSKQAGGFFLVYLATFVIQKNPNGCFLVYKDTVVIRQMCVQNKWRLLFSLLMIQ